MLPSIFTGTMSDIANTDDVNIGDNEGKVGAENEVAVEGGLGKNVALSNTAHIDVTGTNADTGLIGAKNSYDVTACLTALIAQPHFGEHRPSVSECRNEYDFALCCKDTAKRKQTLPWQIVFLIDSCCFFISAGTMAHRIGNTEKIIVGDNSGKIGADNAISISDKAALDPLLQGIPTRNEVNIGNITNMAIGENIGDIGANNNCNVSGRKGVKLSIGNIYTMNTGSNTGDIGAGNNCNIMGGEGVKIAIGNIGNMTAGDNAGGIGVGNNCNVNGGKGVEINIGNATNTVLGSNAGGIGAGNNINISQCE
ncbi:hypothetical protein E3U43_022445 [Larimichthys crocea]|uniref:Uncharacterized protein n=1 Tax=Larimichthys crocea TaxID=215358 RepID=A0ACD3R3I7_LARCR|nr:hypothetical protein E3U43_022445 [Larimichthys crocea]